jgi:ADP-ribosyl-[dinitrogen reductase] hydrolase
MTTADDRIAGVLLGTALGDALGLPAEGMSARAIARRFGRVDRFRLLGGTGFVSDDTEQSALVAQSLIRAHDDPERCARAFRRSLLGWFCRLPWGIGMGTIKACLRIALGLRPSGVMSAGNGAAMRAAIVGASFRDDPARRAAFGRALAEVTHRDPRAVEGALYVAELAAACAKAPAGAGKPGRYACQEEAQGIVTLPALEDALDRACDLAHLGTATREAAEEIGTSGYVLHSVPLATYAFLRHGDDPLAALAEVIGAGGDTDSNAAILGAWLGALRGAGGLPSGLIGEIHDGPFGPSHLRALAESLARIGEGETSHAPRYSALAALGRNLALMPVILGHGFRRLLPF